MKIKELSKKDILILSSISAVLLLFFFYSAVKKNMYNKAIESLPLLPANFDKFADENFLSEINALKENPNISIFKLSDINHKMANLDSGIGVYDYDDNYSKVYIFTENNKGQKLEQIDGYVSAQLVVLDTDNKRFTNDEVGKVKVRGNSTADSQKKPYNIKFSKKQDLFDFGSAKKWCLLSESFDPTMLRNKTTLNLAKEMNMEYTPESEFVMLYMDGVYKGCYLLCEKIEADKSRVDIDPDKGDFLIELDIEREEADEVYFISESGWRFKIHNPEITSEEEYDKLEERINHYDEIINSNDYKLLEKNIDLDSFAKMYLINEFVKTIDFDFSSVFFYEKDGKLYAGPVWDFDLSSGNYSISNYSSFWVGEDRKEKKEISITYEQLFCAERNPIFKKLFDYDEFDDVVSFLYETNKDKFKNLYAEGGEIDTLLNKYQSLFDSNYETKENGGAGWKIDKEYSHLEHDRFPTYEENLNYFKEWLKDRYNWIKENAWWAE